MGERREGRKVLSKTGKGPALLLRAGRREAFGFAEIFNRIDG
jgi:hypothetical protein